MSSLKTSLLFLNIENIKVYFITTLCIGAAKKNTTSLPMLCRVREWTTAKKSKDGITIHSLKTGAGRVYCFEMDLGKRNSHSFYWFGFQTFK